MPSALQVPARLADAADMPPFSPAEVVARLVRIAEELAQAAADLVMLEASQPAPSPVIQIVPSEERVAWTVAEFAKAHGLAKGTVYELIKRGEITAGRVNESLRISEAERLRWWAECEQRHAAEIVLA